MPGAQRLPLLLALVSASARGDGRQQLKIGGVEPSGPFAGHWVSVVVVVV